MTGPSAPRVVVSPLRAMSIKPALRDLLSVSYDMITILLTGSLRSPPPYPVAPDFSTGEVVASATKGGGLHFLARQGGCKVFFHKRALSII